MNGLSGPIELEKTPTGPDPARWRAGTKPFFHTSATRRGWSSCVLRMCAMPISIMLGFGGAACALPARAGAAIAGRNERRVINDSNLITSRCRRLGHRAKPALAAVKLFYRGGEIFGTEVRPKPVSEIQ